jgi:uncharacterized protein YkwD
MRVVTRSSGGPAPPRQTTPLAALLVCAAIGLLVSGCEIWTHGSHPLATRLVLASNASDAQAAAALISHYRGANGLGPVSSDATLARAAEVQARAVASAGSLSHGDFPARMASFGIRGVAAENLSAGRTSVVEAIASWKASPGHNENLLLAGVRRVGIARIDTPGVGYGQYWALVLSQ